MSRFLLAALCLWTQPLWADSIRLKDGTSLQGTIIGAGPDRIELNTINGTITIPRERITGIDLSPPEPPPTAPAERPEALPPIPLPHRPTAHQEASGFGSGADILSLQVGLAIPISQVSFSAVGGGDSPDGDVGVLIGLQYLHQFDRRLDLGLEFEYADRSVDETFGLLPNSVAYVTGDSLVFLGEGRWNLRDHGTVRPYLLGGLGAHRTSETIDARPFPGYYWANTPTFETRRLIDSSLWGFASCLRFGVEFSMERSTSLGVELSWLRLAGGTYGATPQGQALGLTGVSGALDIISLAGRFNFAL